MTTAEARRNELKALVEADKKAYLEKVKNFCNTFVETKISEAVKQRRNCCRINRENTPKGISLEDVREEIVVNGFQVTLGESLIIYW